MVNTLQLQINASDVLIYIFITIVGNKRLPTPNIRRERLMNQLIDEQKAINTLHIKAKKIIVEKEDLLRRVELSEERWTQTAKEITAKQKEIDTTQLNLMKTMSSKFLLYTYLYVYIFML